VQVGLGRASCAVSRFSAPQYQAHLPCKSHVCFASCSPQGSHAPPQGPLGRDSLGRAHSSTCLQESSPTRLKTRASKLFLAQWRRCNQPNVQLLLNNLRFSLRLRIARRYLACRAQDPTSIISPHSTQIASSTLSAYLSFLVPHPRSVADTFPSQ
jgi:hypothetical protein